jgi:hypothetical protein
MRAALLEQEQAREQKGRWTGQKKQTNDNRIWNIVAMLEKFFPSSLPLQPQDDLQQVDCNRRATILIPRLNAPQLMVALETKIDSDGCSKKAKVCFNLFLASPPHVKYCAACCCLCAGHMPTRERKSEALRASRGWCVRPMYM